MNYFASYSLERPKSFREWATFVLAFLKIVTIVTLFVLLMLHLLFGEGISKGSCLKEALLQKYNLDLSLPVEISNSTNNASTSNFLLPNKKQSLLSDDLILIRIINKDEDYNLIANEEEEKIHYITTIFKPTYEFGTDPSYVLMNEHDRIRHNVRLLNVTVSLQCLLNSNSAITTLIISNLIGYDVYVINEFVYGIHYEGILRNLETHETFNWNKDTFEYVTKSSLWIRFTYKIRMLFLSILLLFLISSITSLVVRVLISSGVVFMFPLFQFMRGLNYSIFDNRFLTLSYPWLGADIEGKKQK